MGLALILIGLLGGFLVSVGQYCAGAFLPQSAAAAQDAHPSGSLGPYLEFSGTQTHYEAACNAAASQQVVVWAGLIVLGAFVATLSLAWRYAPLSDRIRSRALGLLWPAWIGGALLFVGVVAGWAIPVGKDCSGAFGDQAPAKVVAAVTGSTWTLTACKEDAVPMSYLSWTILALGAVGIALGTLRTYRSLRVRTGVPKDSAMTGGLPGSREPEASEPPVTKGVQVTEELVPFPSPKRRHRRWPYVTAIVVLAVAVLALGGLYGYSTNSAGEWRQTAEKTSRDLSSMTSERDGLSAKNQTLTSQLSDTDSRLSDTTSQLNDANDRIRSLANEKAQLGDNAALRVETEAQLAQLVGASQRVSTDLSSCIGDLQNLQHYLVNSASYDQASLIAYAQGINSKCDTARAESDALTKTIQGFGK